jgi:phytanoyl-CoA hydroxylase
MTPHASFENTTEMVRYSMDLRYQSAALPTNAKITRLVGEAIGDPARGVPVACYPPEADFLVRSKARPDEVVSTAAEFHRIRKNHPAAGFSTWRWKKS